MSSEKDQIGALSILVTGVRLAQSRGTYSLEEAHEIYSAVKIFTDPQDTVSNDDVVEAAARRRPGRPKK